MLATGVASDRVGTSIKRTYTNLSKGASATKAQKEMWQELGMSAEGIAKSMQVDSVGTLLTVFDAINNLPDERQVAALSTLFGQWAIEGNAKIVGNMDVFTDALKMVSDPNLYAGSMEREFIIKASTSESIDAMLANTKYAMAVEIGDAFLPAKKEFSLAMIDFLNTIRGNMPELEQLAGTLGELASGGVAKLADVMDKSLPYIQKGLDYLANNGPEVAETLGKIAAVFVGMKFAPGIESLLSGAGSLLMGTPGGGGGKRSGGLVGGISNLFKGGQKAGGAAGGLAAAFGGAASGNGFFTTLSAMASSLISGNGIKGTTGLLDAAAGTPGLLSGYQGVGSAIRNRVGGSGIGQYLGGIFSSVGDLGTTLGNTKAGGAISGVLNKLTLPLRKGIAGVGAAATIQGSVFQQNISGLLGKAGGFLGGIASSGAGVLGSVWGPIASGFGSIFTGAAPVIGVISAIIAVVSILGDNIDSIRGIVQNVFGDEGLAIFDSFLGVLQNVGDFISGLFVDGGVAEAMAPLRDSIVNLFGPEAGAAFDGLTTILQSVMGIVGQIVNFANTTVKPIIQEIFGFLTTTV
ncbi:MAG: phage tail tape measure protein, partial [Clostridia bacterium]|nr:phage tail tape measure protein [Clostridia bacterium]